jgi:hypothetical protein
MRRFDSASRYGRVAHRQSGGFQTRVREGSIPSSPARLFQSMCNASMIAENRDYGEPTKRHRTHETSVLRADWRASWRIGRFVCSLIVGPLETANCGCKVSNPATCLTGRGRALIGGRPRAPLWSRPTDTRWRGWKGRHRLRAPNRPPLAGRRTGCARTSRIWRLKFGLPRAGRACLRLRRWRDAQSGFRHRQARWRASRSSHWLQCGSRRLRQP